MTVEMAASKNQNRLDRVTHDAMIAPRVICPGTSLAPTEEIKSKSVHSSRFIHMLRSVMQFTGGPSIVVSFESCLIIGHYPHDEERPLAVGHAQEFFEKGVNGC
jgi:hypothetical protein